MKKEQIEAIDALFESAAKAPWAIDRDNRPGMEWNNFIVRAATPHMAVCFMTHDNTPDNIEGEANVSLITELVNAWPQLREAALRTEQAERELDEARIREANLAQAITIVGQNTGALITTTGSTCGTCGFSYFERHGHIIPCPVCELSQAREALKEFIRMDDDGEIYATYGEELRLALDAARKAVQERTGGEDAGTSK